MKPGLDKAKKIAARLTEQLGYELYQVELVRENGNSILRITIDHPNGIQHDDCEKFSRAIDPVLDLEDPIPHSYYLEVSSPGIFRELRSEQDFSRFQGSLVKVLCSKAVDELKNHRGYLTTFNEHEITLTWESNEQKIPRSLIKKIHLDIL